MLKVLGVWLELEIGTMVVVIRRSLSMEVVDCRICNPRWQNLGSNWDGFYYYCWTTMANAQDQNLRCVLGSAPMNPNMVHFMGKKGKVLKNGLC